MSEEAADMRVGVNLRESYYQKNMYSVETLLKLIVKAEEIGAESVWLNEDVGRDSPSVLAVASRMTSKIRLATGVLNVYLRPPMLIAMTIATLDELSGGRAVLGLGSGHHMSVTDGHGIPIEKPLERIREYATIIRRALAGEKVNSDGKFPSLDKARIGFDMARKNIPIYIAANLPKMVKLAGELGDGVLLNMASKRWVKETVLPNVRRSGVSTNGFDVACMIPCSVSSDRVKAQRLAARYVAGYCWGGPFNSMLEKLGLQKESEAVKHALKDDDMEKAIDLVVDSFLDEFALYGTGSEIGDRLEDFRKAGVSLPIVKPCVFSGEEPAENVMRQLSQLHL